MDYGKHSRVGGLLSLLDLPLLWEIDKGVKVWRETWSGGAPLSASFPSLFGIGESREAWLRDYSSGPEQGKGTLYSPNLSMTGKWRRYKDFSLILDKKVWLMR